MKPLRLLNRERKPKRHLGVIDSDAVVGRYLDQVEQMPTKYRIDTSERVPWLRRAWRRILQMVR